MRNIYFDGYGKFAENINKDLEYFQNCDKDSSVCVIAKYDDAKQVIVELVGSGHAVSNIELKDCNYDGYEDEFIISLDCEGIWCEKMKVDGKYLSNEGSSVTYIMDGCSKNVIHYCNGDIAYVSVRGNKEDETDSDCEYHSESEYISKDKDGNITGFTKCYSDEIDGSNCHISCSFCSNDLDILKEYAKVFGINL